MDIIISIGLRFKIILNIYMHCIPHSWSMLHTFSSEEEKKEDL